MISRVAEHCFWLHRYVERAESTARMMSVNRVVILDAEIHEAKRWKPLIAALGEDERFERLVGADSYDNDKRAEEYLTWSSDNPSSIVSSLAAARENARTTREVISREMWETLNTVWQWLAGSDARKLYRRDRLEFYERIRGVCTSFQGHCHNTMLHDEPFDFMRLGMLMERSNQTVRAMQMKSHWLVSSRRPAVESPMESAQWMALLRSCAAVEPFFKRNSSAPTGPRVARFLLTDGGFPRSVLHCADRARNFIQRIDEQNDRKRNSQSLKLSQANVKTLRAIDTSDFTEATLQQALRALTAASDRLHTQLYADYFDPTLS
jgi:uncharacterized alpha-E superfamily protein